jgi:hypothetical protein
MNLILDHDEKDDESEVTELSKKIRNLDNLIADIDKRTKMLKNSDTFKGKTSEELMLVNLDAKIDGLNARVYKLEAFLDKMPRSEKANFNERKMEMKYELSMDTIKKLAEKIQSTEKEMSAKMEESIKRSIVSLKENLADVMQDRVIELIDTRLETRPVSSKIPSSVLPNSASALDSTDKFQEIAAEMIRKSKIVTDDMQLQIIEMIDKRLESYGKLAESNAASAIPTSIKPSDYTQRFKDIAAEMIQKNLPNTEGIKEQRVIELIDERLEHSLAHNASGSAETPSRNTFTSEQQIKEIVTEIASQNSQELMLKLNQKVDNEVLEELVKHLATREELKKIAKKRATTADLRAIEKLVADKMREFKAEMQTDEKENYPDVKNLADDSLNQKLKSELKSYISTILNQKEQNIQMDFKSKDELKEWSRIYLQNLFESKIHEHLENIRDQITVDHNKPIAGNVNIENVSSGMQVDEEAIERRLARQFDEKLFLVCSDLSNVKTLFSKQFEQPFYRCGQWLWKSGVLKMGSAVPWNYQTLNTGIYHFEEYLFYNRS